MNKRLILGSLATLAVAAGAITGSAGAFDESDNSNGPKPSSEIHVETLAVTNLRDDRKLVGLAQDVFTARVLDQHGRTVSGPVPETQYDVKVLRSIKGDLSGTVVVSQQGGTNEDGDTVVVDSDPPLRVGGTYLFATRTNKSAGWHTVIPRRGDLVLDTPQKQASVISRFKAAHAAQIPFRPAG